MLSKTPVIIEKPTAEDKAVIRLLVKQREDIQSMRKAMDNRIGRKADGSQQNIDERSFRAEDIELLIGIADSMREQEHIIEQEILKRVQRFPIYNEYLVHQSGIGPGIAGIIIAEYDIHKATTVSKMWQFTGLNPSLVRGKKRVENDDGTFSLIDTDILVRGDRLTSGFVSPFNQHLRTMMIGRLGMQFLKSGLRKQCSGCGAILGAGGQKIHECNASFVQVATNKYAQFYTDMKNRLEHSEKLTSERIKGGKEKDIMWKDATPKHRHDAAIRYAVKMFLKDLYVAWRIIEGLPVREPYQEEYLGKEHEVVPCIRRKP